MHLVCTLVEYSEAAKGLRNWNSTGLQNLCLPKSYTDAGSLGLGTSFWKSPDSLLQCWGGESRKVLWRVLRRVLWEMGVLKEVLLKGLWSLAGAPWGAFQGARCGAATWRSPGEQLTEHLPASRAPPHFPEHPPKQPSEHSPRFSAWALLQQVERFSNSVFSAMTGANSTVLRGRRSALECSQADMSPKRDTNTDLDLVIVALIGSDHILCYTEAKHLIPTAWGSNENSESLSFKVQFSNLDSVNKFLSFLG